MKTKLAFFDVDGTLSVPIFVKDNEPHIGFSQEEWLDFSAQKKEHAYDDCKPVDPVRRYARKLKEEGAVLYVLTTTQSAFETSAKVKFIKDHYEGLFEEVIGVDSDKKKLDVIKDYAAKHQVAIESCELIEDTFATLLYVNDYHVKPTHVAAIVCDL